MARVTGGQILKGEGRVSFVKAKYAVLTKPGLDGGVILVPSSILGQMFGYPEMSTLVSINDILKFEAVGQEDKNGIKWQALDGSVEIVRRASEFRGSGAVSFLDDRQGQFGFIETPKGSVWFNANVVRPETRDVTKVLKKGQVVNFVAIENPSPKNQCKYRATLVHSKAYTKKVEPKRALKATKSSLGLRPSLGRGETGSSDGSRESSRPSTPLRVGQPPHTQPLDIILNRSGDNVFPGSKTSQTDAWTTSNVVGSGWDEWSGANGLEYFTPKTNVEEETRMEDSSLDREEEEDSSGYSSQLVYLQRIAHRLLGIQNRHDCPVCSPVTGASGLLPSASLN